MNTRRWLGIPVVLSLGLGLSCGGPDRVFEPFTVGPAGGPVDFLGGDVHIVFPAGAVDSNSTFQASTVSTVPAAPTMVGTGGVVVTPVGYTFNLPVAITIKYLPNFIPAGGILESELGLYQVVNGQWVIVPGSSVNTTAHTLSASVSVLDTFGILGAPVVTLTASDDTVDLTVGGATAALSAQARNAANALLPSRTISWTSTVNTVATVSAAGVVTPVAQGTTKIVASCEGRTDTVVVNVAPSVPPGQLLASIDFNDSTRGVFTNPYGTGFDMPNDPTASGRGRVGRFTYAPLSGQSMERAIVYIHPTRIRYGQTIWMRARLYQPSGTGNYNAEHNRKLIDWQGGGVRMTLHRVGPTRELKFSYVDAVTGVEVERLDAATGIVLADNQWHTIEVRMTTNSADGVSDGILEVYMNGASTPTYSRTTSLRWITEGFTGGSYFQRFLTGFQLTINSGDPVYQDIRYWDDIAFSTTRIGP